MRLYINKYSFNIQYFPSEDNHPAEVSSIRPGRLYFLCFTHEMPAFGWYQGWFKDKVLGFSQIPGFFVLDKDKIVDGMTYPSMYLERYIGELTWPMNRRGTTESKFSHGKLKTQKPLASS